MKLVEFVDVCTKLGMKEFCDFKNDDYFFESLASEYYTFNGYDFAVTKYVNKMAYIWHNGLYKIIHLQTPEELEEQIKLFHKNYKEYLIQNKIKDINKDFKDEDNISNTIYG